MRTRGTHLMVALALVAAGLVAPGQAMAQKNGGPIDLQLFRPAIDSKGYITLNASQVLGHLDLSFGLVVNYAYNVMDFQTNHGVTKGGLPTPTFWCKSGTDSTKGCKIGSDSHVPNRYFIENMVTGHFQAALGLFKHVEVGIGFPVSVWIGDTNPDPVKGDDGAIDVQGVGDLGFHVKGRVLNTSKHPVGLGAILSIYVPTGDEAAFLGSGRVTIAPSVILDKEFFRGRLSLALNVGGRFRSGTEKWVDERKCSLWTDPTDKTVTADCGTGESIETDHHLTFGIGATVAIVPQRFSLVGEIVGQTGFNSFADPGGYTSALEFLGGFKLYLGRNSYFGFGFGRGLRGEDANHQYGSPSVRIWGAFIFEPSIGDRDGDGIKDDVDKCPDHPEDFDDFEDQDGCPDPDNDRDGILDEDDKCPNEPEDKDGIEDDDGCPEADVLDRDGDGIPDSKDKCPDDPEDKDGFEDDDGCPDPDNDKDGILDVDDLCPNKPEDKDGFEDKDGCPDPDNDKDRILDVDDTCPNEPETYNGYQDEDGCPDKGKVIVHKGRIEILEKIYFETDKAIIKPVSYPILDAVAKTLKGNPQILQMEIQGHADERGSDDHNMKLTGDRAHSVKTYMVNKGIDANRLQAKGYGETRPVDRRSNEEAWSKNRRVEFVIIKRAE